MSAGPRVPAAQAAPIAAAFEELCPISLRPISSCARVVELRRIRFDAAAAARWILAERRRRPGAMPRHPVLVHSAPLSRAEVAAVEEARPPGFGFGLGSATCCTILLRAVVCDVEGEEDEAEISPDLLRCVWIVLLLAFSFGVLFLGRGVERV